VLNANEARERAALVKNANQFVNETAAGALIAAAERGESVAEIAVPRRYLQFAPNLIGHVYDAELADALDAAAHHDLALAVRKLSALGFNVAATVRETSKADRKRIHIDTIRLSYAMADEMGAHRLATPLLTGVALPPAFQWKRRAGVAKITRSLEDRVLALIDTEVERGRTRARLNLRQLAGPSFAPDLAERVAMNLRDRGFKAEVGTGGADLNILWDA
jgi:hypothetical protein